ncbi:MAG: HEAT repeat domain-containing protein [Spirochaetales bacterium]|nr:MAG: HEAT repeat domain-containing protein [Spirochaetales bacterium]
MKASLSLLAGIFLLVSMRAFPQEGAGKDVSIRQERAAVLKFGIDTEVVEVLKKLLEEKDTTLKDDALRIFSGSVNTDVKEACLKYFTELELPDAEEQSLVLLENYDGTPEKLILAAIRYTEALKFEKGMDLLLPIIGEESVALTPSAIKALGGSRNPEHQDFLLAKLQDEDFNGSFRPEIILALGEMKSGKALDTLLEIAADTDRDATLRRYACDSLGKIGDGRALDTLIRVYQDPDPLTRLYALSAISRFGSERTRQMLIEALKDSFWRIRITAAEGLGKLNAAEAVEILSYKAEKDPEQKVKEAAVTALGSISSPESLQYLLSLVQDKEKPVVLRFTAAKVLVEKNLRGSLAALLVLLDQEWSKKDSKLLDSVCKELSGAKDPALHDLFARFLDHGSMTIQIYGVLGIQRNGFRDLTEVLEKKKETAQSTVGKYITAALETLKTF